MDQLDKELTIAYVRDFAPLVDPHEFRARAADAYSTLDAGLCTYDEFLERLTQKVQAWRRSAGMELMNESWHEVLRDGTPIKTRPGDELLPAQAYLIRNGTHAHLSSHSLTADELATIAASLKPASEATAF